MPDLLGSSSSMFEKWVHFLNLIPKSVKVGKQYCSGWFCNVNYNSREVKI